MSAALQLFALSLMALHQELSDSDKSPTKIAHFAEAGMFESEDKAQQKGMELALEKWPIDEGWQSHGVAVTNWTREFAEQAASSIKADALAQFSIGSEFHKFIPMKPYLIASAAMSEQGEFDLACGLVISASEAGANLLGQRGALNKWPMSKGWSNHKVNVSEITKDDLLEALKELTEDKLNDIDDDSTSITQ